MHISCVCSTYACTYVAYVHLCLHVYMYACTPLSVACFSATHPWPHPHAPRAVAGAVRRHGRWGVAGRRPTRRPSGAELHPGALRLPGGGLPPKSSPLPMGQGFHKDAARSITWRNVCQNIISTLNFFSSLIEEVKTFSFSPIVFVIQFGCLSYGSRIAKPQLFLWQRR